jgi:hypothetical protein
MLRRDGRLALVPCGWFWEVPSVSPAKRNCEEYGDRTASTAAFEAAAPSEKKADANRFDHDRVPGHPIRNPDY